MVSEDFIPMKYLFFDIECANCFNKAGKICEFGFVLTDENFNELSAEELVVNPDCLFDPYTIEKLLSFTEEEYKQHPKYPEFYDKIRSLITEKDVKVIGQNTRGDAHFLADESTRYSLPFINFKFYDLGEIYKTTEKLDYNPGLEKMLGFLGIEIKDKMHNALVDARATMLVLKGLCEKHGKGIEDLLENALVGEIKDGHGQSSIKKGKKRKGVASIGDLLRAKGMDIKED